MSAAPSSPLATALQRVIDEERLRMVRAGAKVRLIITTIAFAIFSTPVHATPIYSISRLTTVIWLVVAALVYETTRRASRPGRILLIAPPMLDILLIGLANAYCIRLLQTTPHAPGVIEAEELGIFGMAYMCGLVVTSALTISLPALAAVAATASVLMLLIMSLTTPFSPLYGLAIMPPLGIGLLLRQLINRINVLVTESRKKDLLGKYVLGERIGSGGMAEVFEATYCPEGGFVRKVAIKKILPSHADSPEFVKLFRREAELGAMLVHPNLVQVLDFGADSSTYFLAMEFVDGVTLSQILSALSSQNSKLSLPAWAYLAWCLADALSFIHDASKPSSLPLRLVHRDVNPPNILVSVSGDVKLTDFGIAREVSNSNLTAAGSIRGKLSYSAPEQFQGASFDHRVDLFALGITLWEAWVGDRFYPHGATDAEIIHRGLLESPPPPSSRRPDTPPELDALVLHLLAKSPADRTESGRHLMQQLMTLPANLSDSRAGKNELALLASTAKAQRKTNPNININLPTPPSLPKDAPTATINIQM